MAKIHLSEMKRLKLSVLGQKSVEHFSPIGINIEIPQTHRFSEIKTYHNWKSCGKHDS